MRMAQDIQKQRFLSLVADKVLEKHKRKICLIFADPVTPWCFYQGLIKRLNKEYAEVVLVSSDFPKLYWLEKELDVTIFATDIIRRITPLRDLVSVFKLCRFLRRKKFDIVHAHTPKAGFIGITSSFLAGIPNRVYTIHGLPMEGAKGLTWFLLWLAEWLACKLATSLLAVSPSLKQLAIDEKLCSANKIQVLGQGSACGIDLSRFSWSESLALSGKQTRANYNIPEDAMVIGFVGRVVPDKGIKALVQAFEKLQEVVPESFLLLVGEPETIHGTLDDKTIESMKSNEHILYNGEFVDDVLPYYAAMDIVVYPSRHEGFGLTLLEAAALGLSTITCKVTGCVDAVVDNITGLIVEVDNVQQLFSAMLRLVKDSELRKELGQQGRQRAKDIYDSELLIAKHIDLYKSL